MHNSYGLGTKNTFVRRVISLFNRGLEFPTHEAEVTCCAEGWLGRATSSTLARCSIKFKRLSRVGTESTEDCCSQILSVSTSNWSKIIFCTNKSSKDTDKLSVRSEDKFALMWSTSDLGLDAERGVYCGGLKIWSTCALTCNRGLSYLEVRNFQATEKLLADWGILAIAYWRLDAKQLLRSKNLEESLREGLVIISLETKSGK